MKADKKPKEVAVMHCWAHQQGFLPVHQRNKLEDKMAKEAAQQGILALISEKFISIPNVRPNYSQVDLKLALHLKIIRVGL